MHVKSHHQKNLLLFSIDKTLLWIWIASTKSQLMVWFYRISIFIHMCSMSIVYFNNLIPLVGYKIKISISFIYFISINTYEWYSKNAYRLNCHRFNTKLFICSIVVNWENKSSMASNNNWVLCRALLISNR